MGVIEEREQIANKLAHFRLTHLCYRLWLFRRLSSVRAWSPEFAAADGRMSRGMAHARAISPYSRDVLLHVLGQDFVDQRLVPDFPPAGFLSKSLEHARIDTNGDQLTRLATEWRAADSPHRFELRWRRIRNVREVNSLRGTRHVRADSRAAR